MRRGILWALVTIGLVACGDSATRRDAGADRADTGLPERHIDAASPDAALDRSDGGSSDGTNLDAEPPLDAGRCDRGTYAGSIEIRSNADVATLAGHTAIEGALSVTAGVTSLEGLECLTTVHDLSIFETTELGDLHGLSAIRDVGLLAVMDNAALTSLDGLGPIPAIATELTFSYNPELRQIDALASVLSVGGGIVIRGNPLLESVEGLDSLQTVGSLDLGGPDSLTAVDLESLRSVVGSISVGPSAMIGALRFPALATAAGGVDIRGLDVVASIDLGMLREADRIHLSDCPLLTSITGTGDFTTSSTAVDLYNLPALERIAPFSSLTAAFDVRIQQTGLAAPPSFPSLSSLGRLTVSANPRLSTLSGLDALTSLGSYLEITDNTALSQCTADAFRDRLVMGGFDGASMVEGNLVCP